jgi:hypothetical protein
MPRIAPTSASGVVQWSSHGNVGNRSARARAIQLEHAAHDAAVEVSGPQRRGDGEDAISGRA